MKNLFLAFVGAERMQMIVSHIERANPLGNFLTEERTLSELLGNVMARAGFGLALVTADRRIVYANDTADTLMRARNGLRCERNCIIAASSTTSRKLQSLITAACRQTGESVQGGSLIIRNEDGAASLVVHVVPLCQSPVVVAPSQDSPVAGLVINDCQRTLSERISAFADLFTLTPGEARVVSHLITGAGLTKAASRLSIALSTARSHLKHISEKTSTHRQAELVKVFYEVTLPWYGYRHEKDTACVALSDSRLSRRDHSALGHKSTAVNTSCLRVALLHRSPPIAKFLED